jgi:hypothetical protein
LTTTLRRALAAFATAFLVAGSALVAAPAATAAPAGLSITTPEQGSAHRLGTIMFTGTIPEGATDFYLGLDGPADWNVPQVISGSTFAFGWYPGSEGTHTVNMLSGGQSASVTFLVDNVAPAIAFTSPAEGSGASKGDEVTISFTASGLGGGSLYLMPSGDGEHLIASGVDTYDGSIQWTIPGAPANFEHRLRAVDAAGNESIVYLHMVGVDTEAPTATFEHLRYDGTWEPLTNGTRVNPDHLFELRFAPDEELSTWSVSGLTDGDSIAENSYFGTFAPGWNNGQTRTLGVSLVDLSGNTTPYSFGLVADTRKPTIAVDAAAGTLSASGSITGTQSDNTGVDYLDVILRKFRADETCGAVQYTVPAALGAGTWSLALAPVTDLADGTYCVQARAIDAVGNVRTVDGGTVTIDVTAPAAPTGLAPADDVWSVDSLSWAPVSGAASYEYRSAGDPVALDGSPIYATTDPWVNLFFADTTFWQVRAIDAVGNVGDWSAVAAFNVLATPSLDPSTGCTGLFGCIVFTDAINASWNDVPGADGYEVEYTRRGDLATTADDVSRIVEVGAGVTSVSIDIPARFDDGFWTVRVRAVSDHRLQPGNTKKGEWSDGVNYLRDRSRPAAPVLTGPGNGSIGTNPSTDLTWLDDPQAVAWQLRLGTDPTTAPNGRLVNADRGDFIDPSFLLYIYALTGLPLDELDGEILADLDCEALGETLGGFGGAFDFDVAGCADGSLLLNDLPDGTYYWQARAIDMVGFFTHFCMQQAPVDVDCGDAKYGKWSQVFSFTVDRDYVAPVTPATPAAPVLPTTAKATKASAAPTDEPSAEPTVEPTAEPTAEPTEEPTEAPSDSTAGGAEAETTSGDGGEPFPTGWVFGGIGALVAAAGAFAFIRFLILRGR